MIVIMTIEFAINPNIILSVTGQYPDGKETDFSDRVLIKFLPIPQGQQGIFNIGITFEPKFKPLTLKTKNIEEICENTYRITQELGYEDPQPSEHEENPVGELL